MKKLIAITFMGLMFFGCSENTGNTSQPDDKISAVDNPNTETIKTPGEDSPPYMLSLVEELKFDIKLSSTKLIG